MYKLLPFRVKFTPVSWSLYDVYIPRSRYRQWLLLGSPGDTGLVVCDINLAEARGQV